MLRVTTDANYRALVSAKQCEDGRRATANPRRAGLEVVGGFLPRVTLLFTGPAPCYRVIYGVIGMEFLQFALEGVGVGGCKFGAIRKRWRATARPP